MQKHNIHQEGFTLVELAIVLVIIGLIVGGVLVGQDMIKAAEIRATLTQMEKYNTAVNTFRGKYNNQLPGDLDTNAETAFSFIARTNAVGHGDGNGLIEGCSAAAIVFGCENALFWRDMAQANLLEGGAFTSSTDALTAVAAGTASTYFPAAKLGRGNFWTVFSAVGYNYYQLTGITSTDAAGVYTLTEALTPNESLNMDNKVDDGLPLTGVVRGMEGTGPLNTTAAAAAPAAGVCVSNAAGNPYNTTVVAGVDFGASPACQLRFRFN